jgi:hypothetical protein
MSDTNFMGLRHLGSAGSRAPGAAVAVALLLCSFTPSRAVAQGASTAVSGASARAADGKPDLSGIWQAVNSAAWDIQDHSSEPFPGLPPRFAMPAGQGVVEGNDIPYQPWALARKQENHANRATADPEAKCYLPGIPRATYMGHPFQIVQTPRRVTMLYEYVHAYRHIPLNSEHLRGPIEFWMGIRAGAGTATRSSWTSSTSRPTRGSIAPATSIARRFTSWSAARRSAPTSSGTRSPSRTRRSSRVRGR